MAEHRVFDSKHLIPLNFKGIASNSENKLNIDRFENISAIPV